MTQIVLNWSVIPACIYEYLSNFKGKDSFYYPMIGPGIYLFIYPASKGYQVYYIGESMEVGCRLANHHKDYFYARPDYYLPTDIEVFSKDIQKAFSTTSNTLFEQETERFPQDDRQRIGRTMIHNTYFAFSKIGNANKDLLRSVEAILQHSLLRYINYESHGYYGERSSVLPTGNWTVNNVFPTNTAKEMIGKSVPVMITLEEGLLSFDAAH